MKQISGSGVKSRIIRQSYTCSTSTLADVIGQAWHEDARIFEIFDNGKNVIEYITTYINALEKNDPGYKEGNTPGVAKN